METLSAAIPQDMIPLPAEAFVQEAIRRLQLSNVSSSEARVIALAITRGATKSSAWRALLGRAGKGHLTARPSLPSAIVRPDDEIVVEDVLVEFAPEDDASFLDYAFFRMLGRSPDPLERIEYEFDLRSGVLDRPSALRRIVDQAGAEGRRPVVGKISALRQMSLVSASRADAISIVKRLNPAEWMTASEALSARSMTCTSAGWTIEPGLVIDAARLPLSAGHWRMKIDLRQPDNVAFDVFIGANGNLDTLLAQRFWGPTYANIEFVVRSEHLAISFNLIAVESGAGSWVADPREITLAKVAEPT